MFTISPSYSESISFISFIASMMQSTWPFFTTDPTSTNGGAPGSGGVSKLSVDGKPVGEVRVERTMPFVYSADEGVDVGVDNETPVTDEYREGNNRFTGKIVKVTVEAK